MLHPADDLRMVSSSQPSLGGQRMPGRVLYCDHIEREWQKGWLAGGRRALRAMRSSGIRRRFRLPFPVLPELEEVSNAWPPDYMDSRIGLEALQLRLGRQCI